MWQPRQEQAPWDPRRDGHGVTTIEGPADDAHDPIRAGSGNCSKCSCPQWEGSGNQCDNCGHAYGVHN